MVNSEKAWENLLNSVQLLANLGKPEQLLANSAWAPLSRMKQGSGYA